jgi:hypothetical protein
MASVAACSLLDSIPSVPSVTPAQNEAVEATDVDGPFRLTFDLPRATWASTEAIEGEARLILTEGVGTRLSGSGSGLLGFGFREVGGDRKMGPAWRADCVPHDISTDDPLTSAITKSGGWSGEDPNAVFYRDFFADPIVRLPVGEWDIIALAQFIEGEGCAGAAHELQATLRVRISD